VQKAIEVLMTEHRLIEQALGSLETFAAAVRQGEPAHRDVIGEYAAFFRGFADACHHGKEEDILFQRMIERGFPRDEGPLAVMLQDHERGRAHVRALTALAARTGDVQPTEAGELLAHADAYVPLLRVHILKEDRVLYPMAARMLTDSEWDAMNLDFAAFEKAALAGGTCDRLRSLADRLRARFRPDPVLMAAAAELAPCGH
jgi:hemerythrin-like domain-containing protein